MPIQNGPQVILNPVPQLPHLWIEPAREVPARRFPPGGGAPLETRIQPPALFHSPSAS
jgi:hypothetical protein